MMTSGSGVNYKSMFDAGSQIVAKEGTKSLFKGAGANILRGVAGAGVLSLYDKLQQVMFGKVYSGGEFPLCACCPTSANPTCFRIWLDSLGSLNTCIYILLLIQHALRLDTFSLFHLYLGMVHYTLLKDFARIQCG